MERNARSLAIILEALEDIGAQHALFGGLAASYYGAARAAKDVDLLLCGSVIKQVQAGLERRGYTMRQFPHVTKMYVPGEPTSIADLVAQETNGVLRAAFAAATPAVILGLPVSIVKRGVFVALKFDAAMTRRRPKERIRDLADIRAVLAKEFGHEDERLAIEIAGNMYPGAVTDLKSLIDDLRHGRQPRVALRAARRSALLIRHGLAGLSRRRALPSRG